MGESNARRFLAIGDPVPSRLPPQVGYFGQHIGHGQQLASKRLAALAVKQQPQEPGPASRQVTRAITRKAEKLALSRERQQAIRTRKKPKRTLGSNGGIAALQPVAA